MMKNLAKLSAVRRVWSVESVGLILKQLLCSSDARRAEAQQRLGAVQLFRCTGFEPFLLCRSEISRQRLEGIIQLVGDMDIGHIDYPEMLSGLAKLYCWYH